MAVHGKAEEVIRGDRGRVALVQVVGLGQASHVGQAIATAKVSCTFARCAAEIRRYLKALLFCIRPLYDCLDLFF
jgi:hypothetical protein